MTIEELERRLAERREFLRDEAAYEGKLSPDASRARQRVIITQNDLIIEMLRLVLSSQGINLSQPDISDSHRATASHETLLQG